MISYQVQEYFSKTGDAQVFYVEGTCLAADTKPTNVANGSKMLEMDTGKIYLFDAQNSVWRAWTS